MREAVREIESHVRERIAAVDPSSDERASLEKILTELGPPQRVAEAYSLGRTVDEAVMTGASRSCARSGGSAISTIGGFFAAIALLVGYVIGVAFLMIAATKPIWPGHVGLIVVDGLPRSFGIALHVPPGAVVYGGYALIPIALVSGFSSSSSRTVPPAGSWRGGATVSRRFSRSQSTDVSRASGRTPLPDSPTDFMKRLTWRRRDGA